MPKLLSFTAARARAALAALSMGAVAVLLAGCSKGHGNALQAAVMKMMMAPARVTVATARTMDVPKVIRVIGTVDPVATVTVESRVDGQIDGVHVRQGQEVKQGAVLFNLDPRTYQAAVQQAQANLARDIALEKNAQITASEEKKLISTHNATQQEYELAHFTDLAAKATVASDKAQLLNVRLLLSYCTIRAPISGKVGRLQAFHGGLVKANTTALIVINQIKPIYVSFAVPEQRLSDVIQALQKHKHGIVVEASPRRPGPKSPRGVLSFVNNQIDTATGTITLRATFVNKVENLWPGEYVNVSMIIGQTPRAVVVPRRAVQTGPHGRFIYVVRKDHSVRMQPVIAGEAYSGGQIISKGIRSGDIVVTDGQLSLMPGKKIVIVKPKAKAKPAGPPVKTAQAENHPEVDRT